MTDGNSKHTPGPWTWTTNDGLWWQLKAPDGTVICDDGSAAGEYGREIEPDSANARLIAAAPDLLEALERIWAMTLEQPNFSEFCDEIVQIARPACVKARGVPEWCKPNSGGPQ